MVKQIIWSKKAKEDKTGILRYWLNRNKSNVYPKKLNDLIKEAILWIVENPFVRRATDYEGVYVKQVRDYFILFEETESTIYILTIWDTRQDPKKIEDIINQK